MSAGASVAGEMLRVALVADDGKLKHDGAVAGRSSWGADD